MTILSFFPFLFSFSLFAPLLLRVATGIVFFRLGCTAVRAKRTELHTLLIPYTKTYTRTSILIIGTLECIGGTLLFFGLFTQLAALILLIITLGGLFMKYRFPDLLPHQLSFLSLLVVVLLSLLLSGPGAFAIDLPL
ncbi:MAG: DoxX family membrane protein [Candidatus Yonathbacteria bacterium]|nr:DoxX family membrane protein [Candidatus Yonathbacteria bacterium]NTW47663.1 DoxX family membrane protein [Candidatus Yonathbacteria bacterium]